MAKHGTLSTRDLAFLWLLDRTPATTRLLLKASCTFPGEPFRDERRIRERLQALASMQLLRAFPASHGVGGPENWYRLTAEGYRTLHGSERELPHRSKFEAISPSRFRHTHIVAEVIVHAIAAAHSKRIAVSQFFGDGELAIEGAGECQYPDCFFQFTQSGKQFNRMFEIDCATEPLDSNSENAVRKKILVYEAHQDAVFQWWKQQGRVRERPYFRVVFLTTTAERASHILWLAKESARNKDRHLCYAASQEPFLGSGDPLLSPIFNDHHGRWQVLVDLHPSSQFTRTPIRIVPPVTLLGWH